MKTDFNFFCTEIFNAGNKKAIADLTKVAKEWKGEKKESAFKNFLKTIILFAICFGINLLLGFGVYPSVIGALIGSCIFMLFSFSIKKQKKAYKDKKWDHFVQQDYSILSNGLDGWKEQAKKDTLNKGLNPSSLRAQKVELEEIQKIVLYFEKKISFLQECKDEILKMREKK